MEARLRHRREDFPPLLESATKRHLAERLALEHECFFEFRIVVTRSATPAEHRVLLMRLKLVAAEERAILIGLKIRKSDDGLLGVERSRDLRNSVGEIVHVVAQTIRPAARARVYLFLEGLRERIVVNERQGVQDR